MIKSLSSGIVLFAVLLVSGCTETQEISSRDAGHNARVERMLSSGRKILVETGDLKSAKAYYDRIKPQIGLDPQASDLGSLVAHLGYTNLLASDVESLDPQAMMVRFPGVLASRFFAPKIVNFNAANAPSPGRDVHTPGWRRLVRLTAQPGSPAEKAGLASAYILFNVFQADSKADPFANESGNNQVMLIPKTFTSGAGDAAYWLDYGPRSQGYKIVYALNAAFDVPRAPGDPTTRDYFVPTACAQCHGHDDEFGEPVNGAYPFAKLNYLDTDQWYDMVEFDFPETGKVGPDVVVDGGKNHTSPDYSAAFEVVRKLNTEMLAQNRTALRPNGLDAFKIAAAEKWLALHSGQDTPLPVSARALTVGQGATWNLANPDELELVKKLDRYCSRCHGAMYYNVFDKQAVLDNRSGITRRINSGSMPQGRTLDAAQRAEIIALLKKVN